MMLDHDWKGNVRELANAMEYTWIVSGGQAIGIHHLPHEVRNPSPRATPAGSVAPAPLTTSTSPRSEQGPASGYPAAVPFPTSGFTGSGGTKTLSDVEMEYILQVYAKNSYNKQVTATELGISLKTLYNKLHKYEEERQQRAG
jgi:DNA-binding NtrC family response regulator